MSSDINFISFWRSFLCFSKIIKLLDDRQIKRDEIIIFCIHHVLFLGVHWTDGFLFYSSIYLSCWPSVYEFLQNVIQKDTKVISVDVPWSQDRFYFFIIRDHGNILDTNITAQRTGILFSSPGPQTLFLFYLILGNVGLGLKRRRESKIGEDLHVSLN